MSASIAGDRSPATGAAAAWNRRVGGAWYGVLGPLTVSADGTSLGLGGRKQRLVLALLLGGDGRPVAPDRLIDGIWGEDAPPRARHTLQAYVSELRKVLDDDIDWNGHGYRLAVDEDRLDRVHFERLVEAGRAAMPGDPARAAAALSDALRLWRGEPFADLRDAPALQSEIHRLQELRVGAIEERIAADLALGRHASLMDELETLTREFPLRERLRAHHMVAAYRCGRQADALRGFERTRAFLAEELGTDPSPALRRVHELVLRQDPSLEPPPGPEREATTVGTPHRGLRGLELRGVIGGGGTTVVHRAYQRSVGREVAVKIIGPAVAGQPDFVRRFEAETRAVATLSHPHVLPLHDSWRDPDGAYLVMPLAAGGNLAEALEDGRLPRPARLRIAGQVGAALAHAHRRGVVHGAVSTGNVLLDEEHNAYLADFGVAAARHRQASDPRTAPEHRSGAPVTPATDVHDLAVLLSDLIGDAGERVPRGVQDVLDRATAARPAERHPGVDELLADLEPVLGTDLAEEPTAADATPVPTRNPYKGLQAFQESDAADFFGRDEVIARLLASVSEHQIVAVVGPSGCGKSSLVRAGLVPALRTGALPGSDRWLVTDLYPGAYPFDELAAALSRVAVEPPSVDELTADADGLRRFTERALPGPDAQLLVVIDQFEELFSMVDDRGVQRAFLDALTSAGSGARVRLVLTLRADFFDRPLEHHGFGSLLRAGLVPLLVPSHEELAEAIVGPARRAGLELEAGLADRIVRDVDGQPGGLPLMQHALAELADRRRGRLLTSDAYRATGGVTGALGRRAEKVFTSFTDEDRRVAEQVFLRLVAVNDTTDDGRRRVRRAELEALGLDAGALDRVLTGFGDHRLLSFDRDPVTRGATVEVAHEALLQGWDRLRRWVADRRSDLLLHRRLVGAVRDWEDADRDPAFLLDGERLDRFRPVSATDGVTLTTAEQAFLTASRAREATTRRRRRRGRQAVTVVLSLLTVTALMLAGVAVDRSRAAQVRSLLAGATANLDAAPELALMLATDAVDRARGETRDEATGVLHEALLRAPVARSLPGEGPLAWDSTRDQVAGLAEGSDGRTVEVRDATSGEVLDAVTPGYGLVNGVAWSGDGRLLAITSQQGPTLVRDPASRTTIGEIPAGPAGHAFPSFGDGDALLTVSARPDDSRTGRSDTVVVWDVGSGSELGRLRLDTEAFGTHLSPVAPLLLVSEPETSRASVWDVLTGHKVTDLGDQGHTNDFVRFSPDGTRAAVAGPDEVKVWDVATAELVADLDAGRGVRDLAWSPAGDRIVTGGTDAVVRVFDVATATEVHTLRGADSTVWHVDFGPDGRQVAAAWDQVRIWDLLRPAGMEIAAYPRERAGHAAWPPDRSRIVTLHRDGSDAVVEVLDAVSGEVLASIPGTAPPPTRPGPRPPPAKVAVSPDGRIIAATVGGTGTLIVDAVTLRAVTVLDPGGTPAAFSPDSRRLIVGDSEAAHVYDTGTWEIVATLRNREPSPMFTWYYDAAFHPDGDLLFLVDSNNADRNLTLWDVSGEAERVAAFPLPAAATMVSLSGDGSRVAAGDVMSGHVRVWDVAPLLAGEDPASAVVLDLDAGELVAGAELDRDGGMLVTALVRGELAVWDVDRGQRSYTVDLGEEGVLPPTLSPDGRRLLVPAATVVHELTLDPDELVRLARTRVTRPLTDQECRLHLGGDCDAD